MPCFRPCALRLFALTPLNNLQHCLNYAHLFSASRFLNGLFSSNGNIILDLWLFYLRLLFREQEKGVKQGLGVYIDMNGSSRTRPPGRRGD